MLWRPGAIGLLIYEVPEFRRHVVGRHRAQKFTIKPEKECPLGLA